ncbi:hypothetical protein [Sandarakinorhabdus sp.]|uniref:hypothetical protein n=1 Tax=Sandarakinorhabdus sp. TaxID=1916663 RepID=UPI00286EA186|nr:hypothetical protein [Sandarakinorhabdus sp.]
MTHRSGLAALPALPTLPALLAAVMMIGSSGAAAMPQGRIVMALCGSGNAEMPGQQGRRGDCDKACHAACGRRKAQDQSPQGAG